jgi:hypothetical protein
MNGQKQLEKKTHTNAPHMGDFFSRIFFFMFFCGRAHKLHRFLSPVWTAESLAAPSVMISKSYEQRKSRSFFARNHSPVNDGVQLTSSHDSTEEPDHDMRNLEMQPLLNETTVGIRNSRAAAVASSKPSTPTADGSNGSSSSSSHHATTSSARSRHAKSKHSDVEDDSNPSNDSSDTSDEDDEVHKRRKSTGGTRALQKDRVHISEADARIRRLFFATVFGGLFVMIAATYWGALLLESRGTVHTGVTHAFWALTVSMTIVGIVMTVTEKRKWMRNARKHNQLVYVLVLCLYFSLLLSAFHYYVDNPFINSIVTRLMMLLLLMVFYSLVGYGSFSHGCSSIFVILVMTLVLVFFVIRPHRSYFDQFRSIESIREHSSQLIPPNEVQHTIIIVLGTFFLMLYMLWHMDEVNSDVFTHDPLFLMTRIYTLVMTALLFWCFPSIKSSVQIAWRQG